MLMIWNTFLKNPTFRHEIISHRKKISTLVDGYNTTEQCFLNCVSEPISAEISLMGCQPYGIEQNKTENIGVYYTYKGQVLLSETSLPVMCLCVFIFTHLYCWALVEIVFFTRDHGPQIFKAQGRSRLGKSSVRILIHSTATLRA